MRVVKWLPLALLLGLAAVAHAAEFDMREVSTALGKLAELRTAVEDGRARLRTISFVPQNAYGRCYASCAPGPGGHMICSGERGSYAFTFNIAGLRPRFDDSLTKQISAADRFQPAFQQALQQWSTSVARVSGDLEDVSRAAQTAGSPQSQREALTAKLQQAETDLNTTAQDIGMLRQKMAEYLKQQEGARESFNSARADLDANFAALRQQMDSELKEKGCSSAQAVGPYESFRQTVTNQVEQIAGVHDAVSMRSQAAENAGEQLLGETNRMTARVTLVKQKLVLAQNQTETNAALAGFQVKIAADAWREFAVHVAEVAK